LDSSFGEDNHHQVLGAIRVSVKINFIGQRFGGGIQQLDPKRLGGGDGMVAQYELEAR
jgi:hypothetical protein